LPTPPYFSIADFDTPISRWPIDIYYEDTPLSADYFHSRAGLFAITPPSILITNNASQKLAATPPTVFAFITPLQAAITHYAARVTPAD